MNAQLRYYFRVDPDSLDDRQWVRMVKELEWIRTEEARANKIG